MLETTDHLMFGCPFAVRFWAAVGCEFTATTREGDMIAASYCDRPDRRSSSTFLLLCCWQLWKHCNGVVFNHEAPSLQMLLRRCREDAALWRLRLPVASRPDADAWLARLTAS